MPRLRSLMEVESVHMERMRSVSYFPSSCLSHVVLLRLISALFHTLLFVSACFDIFSFESELLCASSSNYHASL